MARASAIPKHYSMTMTPSEMLGMIIVLRAVERDREIHDDDPAIRVLRAAEEAYEGDLPEPPGEPILEPVPV